MKKLLTILILLPLITKAQIFNSETLPVAHINNIWDSLVNHLKTVNNNVLVGTGDIAISGSGTTLNGTGFVKAAGTVISYDNSTYLTSYTETDPTVKTINGIVKSNGTTISAAVAGTDYLTPTGSAASLTSFPTFNQNTTGTAAGLSAPLSFANGGNTGTAATSATTGTMTVSMTTAVITISPSGACTFNASGGVTGQQASFIITAATSASKTLTWGTNFKTTTTLATGTTVGKIFVVSFICIDGTNWYETSRTIAM